MSKEGERRERERARETGKDGLDRERKRDREGNQPMGIEARKEYLGTRYLVAFKPWSDFLCGKVGSSFLFETRPLFL